MSARSVEALVRLARWPNVVLSALGVAFGAWWVGWGPVAAIAFAAGGAACLTVTANVWNDLADIEIDRLAHPERPLPSGLVSARAARQVATISGIAGVALEAAASPALGALSVMVVALMFAYSPWIKRTGLLGNGVVALLASLPFLYGAWVVGRPRGAIVLVMIAVPLHLAREVAKDLEDAPADAGSRRTLPVSAGASVAIAVLSAASLAFLLLLVPFARSRPLFAAAAVPAAALVLYAVGIAVRGHRGSPLVFKLAMVCAMAAFLTARP
jgi:geranylgeranylglycerol-phosphate geranylgeranyltransferase